MQSVALSRKSVCGLQTVGVTPGGVITASEDVRLLLSTQEGLILLILLASFADYAVRRHRDDPRFSLQHEVAGSLPGRVHHERTRS